MLPLPWAYERYHEHMSATGLTANGKCRKTDTNYADKKIKILGTGPDYWAFTRLLGFALDYWALHSTTGLFIRLLGFAPDYWTFTRLLGFCPNTRLLPDWWAFTRILGSWDLPGTIGNSSKTSEILKIVENGPMWLEMS